ncbi:MULTISPECIES: DUF2768 domain-containing protein [Metabacillus]|jgi:hypothetical protein|uniref:DUF2768 domain-containing protein n=1 Tax=Metabacillus hrfriensis TaxID=3048891 RepID=A0ACD4R764_9BACI|nr:MULTISPECIES: DUF2768 domain-containing protein [Metabacillus]UAL50827.1 DUF2768 domain-containing protein [Metabacillus dongyingensis]UOK56872.1 DUF2768 domain-containing protein [Bacillus sp. OVS6]USK27103.1 DUF2768 domain-containing protein [Bacillus sp. CMF21]WHZ56325.1 DUF2768 domain-containing protein [Metabacillus sp. CT-WN-B3]
MSPALMKMWIALASMGFMFVAIISIYFSRFKMKGFLKIAFAAIAYFFMILAGLLIVFVVFSGPVNE